MKQPIDLNQLTQSPHLRICCASDINDSGRNRWCGHSTPTYNSAGDIRGCQSSCLSRAGPPTVGKSPGAEPRGPSSGPSLPNAALQRLTSRLRGWKIAR